MGARGTQRDRSDRPSSGREFLRARGRAPPRVEFSMQRLLQPISVGLCLFFHPVESRSEGRGVCGRSWTMQERALWSRPKPHAHPPPPLLVKQKWCTGETVMDQSVQPYDPLCRKRFVLPVSGHVPVQTTEASVCVTLSAPSLKPHPPPFVPLLAPPSQSNGGGVHGHHHGGPEGPHQRAGEADPAGRPIQVSHLHGEYPSPHTRPPPLPSLVTRGRRRAKDEREPYLVRLAEPVGGTPLQFTMERGGASSTDCSELVLASAHPHHMLELSLHLHPTLL